MEVKIFDLNDNAEGVGKIDNKIVFIENALPGDIVKINNLIDHNNYYEAKLSKIIESSPNRITPKCPYHDLCGGCQLMNLTYNEQLHYKKTKVIKIFKRYCNIEILPNIISSNQYHYRNKITFQVVNGQLGLYKTKSNDLIEIDQCFLISTKMNTLIPILKEINLKDVNQIMLREAKDKIMIQFLGSINKDEVLEKLTNKVDSIYENNNLIYGQKKLTTCLEKFNYHISPASFFQVNTNQTINLYNKIREHLKENNHNVLDLYCGTASIGIYISKICNNVEGIEINASSVKDAHDNIALNNLTNISVKEGSVAKFLTSKKYYDTIIVDPPRSGLDKITKKTLLEIKAKKLIYVSCNPITLARDINILKELYTIEAITLFDMFPNTYHVESVVSLKLK